ncbi:hypothetical protein QVL82_18750 [Cellulosimicrobium funkei]|uniref:hypothetical protein n=1 Tax=Cellulosimicrobium funkei TaxID=264251 RepID=UPI00375746E5
MRIVVAPVAGDGLVPGRHGTAGAGRTARRTVVSEAVSAPVVTAARGSMAS